MKARSKTSSSSRRPPKSGPTLAQLAMVPEALRPRAQVALLFLGVMQGQSLQHRLEAGLAEMTPQERGFSQELLLNTLRRYWPLRAQVSNRLQKPLNRQGQWLETVLLLGAYELLCMRTPSRAVIHSWVELVRCFGYDHLTGLVNGVLRAIDRQTQQPANEPCLELKIHEYLNTGHWLFAAFFKDWKPHFLEIVAAMQDPPQMYLRILQSKTSVDAYKAQLDTTGRTYEPLDEALYPVLNCVPLVQTQNVSLLPGYDEGLFSVQDYAAQAVVQSLVDVTSSDAPPRWVLDACAAPGGKTIGLLDLLPPTSMVHAIDKDPARVDRMSENMQRFGFGADRVQLEAADLRESALVAGVAKDGGYDLILLDVPCSGTGVLRRHPDIAWCRQPQDINALVETQRALLTFAEEVLRPGGILMYATCSILKEENTDMIQWYFQNTATQLEALPLDERMGMPQPYGYQRLPNPHLKGDGFYYALFRKKG